MTEYLSARFLWRNLRREERKLQNGRGENESATQLAFSQANTRPFLSLIKKHYGLSVGQPFNERIPYAAPTRAGNYVPPWCPIKIPVEETLNFQNGSFIKINGADGPKHVGCKNPPRLLLIDEPE